MSDSEKDTNTQSHTRTCKYAVKTIDGARAAVPRDASYVWHDQTCWFHVRALRTDGHTVGCMTDGRMEERTDGQTLL